MKLSLVQDQDTDLDVTSDMDLIPEIRQTIRAMTYENGLDIETRPLIIDRELLPRNLWEVGNDLSLDNPEVDCDDFMIAANG